MDLVATLRAHLGPPPDEQTEQQEPHICHLVPQMDQGGVPSCVLEICNGLDATDYMASCLSLEGRGTAAQRVEPRVQVWAMHLRGGQPGRGPDLVPAEAWKMARLLRRYRVDLLHVHGAGAGFAWGVVAARLAGVRHVVLTEHALEPRVHPAASAAARWTSRVTATTLAGAEQLAPRLGLALDMVRVIPTGVDLERYRPALDREPLRESVGLRPGEVVLGSVGRLEPGRGHRVLLEAVGMLASQGIKPRLVLVGRGELANPLFERAQELGLADRLNILDRAADMTATLATLDVFVVPGAATHLSAATLEAMSTGLPVVAANSGANPQLVRDGQTGLLAPEGNPEVLARLLGELVQSQDRRQTLGQRAREYIEQHHQAQTMVQRYSDLYGELLGG